MRLFEGRVTADELTFSSLDYSSKTRSRELASQSTISRRKAIANAAAAGDQAAVMAYAAEAQTILDADHQAWLLTTPATIVPASGSVKPIS